MSNQKKETVTVNFTIPSRIYLHGRRPVAETKEIVVEHLRNQAAAICDLLAHGAAVVQNGNFDESIYINSCGVFAKIASEYLEAIEIAERDADGELARASLPTAEDLNAKAYFIDQINQTLDEIGEQLEMALTSDKTSEDVKRCLKTIIYEASNEAGLPLSDMTLIRTAFPNIIKALPKDYGRGIYHSLHSILQFDTNAFQDFHSRKPDLKSVAEQLSDLMHNPLLPEKLYNAIGDQICDISDIHTPEIILENLEKISRSKNE